MLKIKRNRVDKKKKRSKKKKYIQKKNLTDTQLILLLKNLSRQRL